MDRHRRDHRHGNGGYEDPYHNHNYRTHPPPRFEEDDEAFNHHRNRRRGNSPSSYQIVARRWGDDDTSTIRDRDFSNGTVKYPLTSPVRDFDYSVRLPPPPPLPPVQQRLSGRKREFPLPDHDGSDRSSAVKLFVGSVPRTAIEEEVRPLFERHGNVLEVALIKDKKTGQQQGCCFVKYATPEDADRAIRALHNQITLPGGTGPVQVRYADGERERIGALEFKLFVGALNKQATEKEVEEIFVQFGHVEDVYLMRDEYKQSRGCGFVKYSSKETTMAAIDGLNGTYTMRGCNQPLIVRFADPKKPKPGESRDVTPPFGPGSGPRFQARPRPTSNLSDPYADVSHINSWRPMNSPNAGPPSNTGIRGSRSDFAPRPAQVTMPSNKGGPWGGYGVPPLNPLPVSGVLSSATSQQQNRATGQQVSMLQKPLPSPQNMPLRPPVANLHGAYPSSQNHYGYSSQLPTSQLLLSQQNATPATAPQTPLNINLRPTQVSPATNQFPPRAQQQPLQNMQHPPSELAQLLSQQTQTLQATFQSSQQAFSQLQQELQSRQQPNQHLPVSQNGQAGKQQSVVSVKCNWTEHTSPDGFKYYYNGLTGESKWEKPEEMTVQALPSQPMQQQPQQAPQQYQGHQQLQQSFYPSPYPTSYPTPGVNAQYPSLAVNQNSQFAMSGIDPNAQEYGRTHITSTDDPSQTQQEPMWNSKALGT